jgi:hypothetical protein
LDCAASVLIIIQGSSSYYTSFMNGSQGAEKLWGLDLGGTKI